MSNVQSPKSRSGVSDAPESRVDAGAVAQGDKPDVGHGTLDIGLSVTDLRKSFLNPDGDRLAVLCGVTFSVNPGESLAIMGASGAGKSTLLHLLAGLESPDHGSITVGNVAIDQAGQAELARFRNKQVGFVFQFHHLLQDLSAAENVSLPLLISRVSAPEAEQRAVQALNQIGLGDRASHLVGNLSGGEQQRVALCRALVHRPSLVLADEPTGNLDTTLGEEIAHSLVEYARKAQAKVVVATHSEAVASLCDRVLTLRDGRLDPNRAG